jgi:hypothetical protein
MASSAEVGVPDVSGRNTGSAKLLKNRLLEVKIQMSRTTVSIDLLVRGKLGLERCGTGRIDLITTPADPWPDNGTHGLRRHTKLLTQTLDGGWDDARRGPFASRMDDAHGRRTRSGEDNREAIRRDDRQREIGAVGDQAISWCSPHQLRVVGLGQDDDTIAMNLPEGDEIVGIDPDSLAEPCTIRQYACAVIAASETQVQ